MNLALLTLLLFAAPQDHSHTDVDKRGDHVMGFSHEKTTHHFLLFKDGGAIQVAANDVADTASRDQIRSHLRHIATMFAAGNFQAPMLVHGKNVPGTAVMTERREQIRFRLEEIERGAKVRIETSDPKALAAAHEFLRFQISDHGTKDTGKVQN